MTTNTTATPSAANDRLCAHCGHAVTMTSKGWMHARTGARHCAWGAARVAEVAR